MSVFSPSNLIVLCKYKHISNLMAVTHSEKLGQMHVYYCDPLSFLIFTFFNHLGTRGSPLLQFCKRNSPPPLLAGYKTSAAQQTVVVVV